MSLRLLSVNARGGAADPAAWARGARARWLIAARASFSGGLWTGQLVSRERDFLTAGECFADAAFMALTVCVEVPPRDREVLASWVRATSIRAGLAQRARIVLLAGEGLGTNEIVRRTGASKPTVIVVEEDGTPPTGPAGWRTGQGRASRGPLMTWRSCWPRWSRRRQRLGVTHWSSRLLAAELGLSNVKIADVWREWGLQPWRAESFKFSTDPALEAKVRDVTGLYLNPPDKAVVLCVDEKPQAQALERKAPVLPLRPGTPEKRSHDYIRHGTTSLFAALEAATGKVTGACYPQHRHEEFLAFLKQIAKAYPRVPCTSCATTTARTTTRTCRRGWRRHPGSPCTSHRRRGRG